MRHGNIHDSLTLRGFRFVDGAGDGGGGDSGSGGGEGGGDGSGGGEFKPPASQADLDKLIESRLARQKQQFKDYDDIKAKAAKWDQHEESSKDDTQKAVDKAKADATTEVTQKFLTRLVRSEVKAAARDAGFYDPEDALSVIDAEKLPVKDDEPDADAIKKLVGDLAEKKPHLIDASKVKKTTTTTPKLPRGSESSDSGKASKGRAAAALRSLGKKAG